MAMKKAAVFVIALSFAASVCNAGCGDDILSLKGWQIEPIDEDTNLLTTEFSFIGPKPIRLLDASVEFRDVLGERIGSFALSRDVKLIKGDTHKETGRWGMFTFERLLDLHPEDVETRVCVLGVVYQDGEIEKF